MMKVLMMAFLEDVLIIKQSKTIITSWKRLTRSQLKWTKIQIKRHLAQQSLSIPDTNHSQDTVTLNSIPNAKQFIKCSYFVKFNNLIILEM